MLCGLGSAVAGPALVGGLGCGGGDEYHRTVGGHQCRQQRPGHPLGAQYIHRIHLLPGVKIRSGHRLKADRAAGIVHQHREFAADGRGQCVHLGLIGDIAGQRTSADLGGEGLDPVGSAGCADHFESFSSQAAGSSCPDSATGTGHDCYPKFTHTAHSLRGGRGGLGVVKRG